MKKSLNRALALLLALTLMVGMVPAYAIGGEESVAPPVEEGIAPETPETPATTPAPEGETVVPLTTPPPEEGDPQVAAKIENINIQFNTIGEPYGTIELSGVAKGMSYGVVLLANFEYTDTGINKKRNDAAIVGADDVSYHPDRIDTLTAPKMPFFALKSVNVDGVDGTGKAVLYINVPTPTGKGNAFELKKAASSTFLFIDTKTIKNCDGYTPTPTQGPWEYQTFLRGSDGAKGQTGGVTGFANPTAPDVSTAPRATLEAAPINSVGTLTNDGSAITGFTPTTAADVQTVVQNKGELDAKITAIEVIGDLKTKDVTIAELKANDIIKPGTSFDKTIKFDTSSTNWGTIMIPSNSVSATISITYETGAKASGGGMATETLNIPVRLSGTGSLFPILEAVKVQSGSTTETGKIVSLNFDMPTGYNASDYKQTVTIKNVTSTAIDAILLNSVEYAWANLSNGANFTFSNPSNGFNAKITQNGEFTVDFTPKASLAAGTYTDTFNMYYHLGTETDAAALPAGTVILKVTATVAAPTDPVLTVNPSAGLWSYASGGTPSPASKTFNIKNNGGAATGITATLAAGASSDFTITIRPAGSLASGATATVVVTPTKKTTTGTCSDTLTVKAGNGGTSAVISLSQTVTAPAAHIATVVLTKDGTAYGKLTDVKLSTTATNLTGDITASDTVTAGTYVTGDIPADKYYVFVGGKDTGKTIDLSIATAATATVNYFTVTATAGTGATTASATVDTKTTAIVQFGKTATLAATAKAGYGGAATWTLTPTGSALSGNTLTVDKKVTATASFKEERIALAAATVALTYGDDFTTNGKTLCTATGGTGSYTYAVTGAVPGLAHEGTTNVWKGRPTTVNTTGTQLTVIATSTVDSSNTATATITVTVAKATPTVALTMGGTHYAGEDTKAAATVTITAPYYNSSSAWVDAPTAPNGGWAADSQISYDKAKILAGANTYTAKFTPAATGTNYAAIYENASGTSASYTPGTKTALTAATIVNTTHNGKPGALNDTLTCSYTPNTVTPVTYQWYTATAATGDTGTAITTNGTGQTYTVTAADYGKYIYCVVDATKSTNGSGTATSNRIPVNYTGSVNVAVDSAGGFTTTHYTVILRPQGETGTIKDVNATSNSGTNPITYTTDPGALTGGVTYDVYVKAFAGQTAGSEVKVDGITVSAGVAAPTVNYYTVKTDKAVTASAYTTLKETDVTVTAKLTNASGAALASGTPVLAGQKVFIAQTALDARYDYKTEWTGAVADGTKPLEASIASVTAPVTAKAILTLNTYTISGTAGGSTTDPKDGIINLTMSGKTAENVDFTKVSSVTNHNANGAQFTVVPKGTYSIDANNIVIAGEYAYDKATSSGVSGLPSNSTFNVVSGAVNGLFNVATVGATYAITLKAGSATAGDDNAAIASTLAELTYGYTAGSTETITVKNTGNRTLYNLKVTKGTDLVATDGTSSAGITTTGVTLNVGATATFVVTTKTGLDAKDAYIQAFTVTANKADTGSDAALGSGVTYTATQKVAAKPLTAVTISGTAKDGETLTRDTVSATDAIVTPDAAKTLAYQWQQCDTVNGTYSNIASATSSSYTVAATDAGKFLRLAVTGSVNYSGVVYSAVTAAVAYTGTVTVKQDDVLTTGGYAVRLQQSDATTIYVNTTDADNNGTYVTATGALLGDKTYNVLVQAVKGTADTEVVTGTPISATDRTEEVNYYTVNFTNTVAVDNRSFNVTDAMLPTTPIDAVTATVKISKSTAAQGDVLTTGNVVLSETTVTFDVTAAVKTAWSGKDYTLNWKKGAASLTSDISHGGTTAQDVSYAAKVDADTVAGTLLVRVFDITANYQAGHLSALKLTDKSVLGKNNFNAANVSGTAYVFAGVPKGSYTIEATAKDSTVTVLGYNLTKDQAVVNNPAKVEKAGKTADMDVTAAKSFGVVTDAATYTVKLQHDINFDTSDDYTDAKAWTYSDSVYGYNAANAVKVKLVNTGNTTLTGLTATAGTDADKFTVSALSATTMAKGGAVTFTITPKTNLAAGTYTVPVVLKATETLTTAVAERTYTLTFEVAKAPITVAEIEGIDTPATTVALDTAATIKTITPASSFTASAITWTPTTTPAAAGTAYTAKVVLTPGSNYKFDTTTYVTAYKIMGKIDSATDATVTMAGDNLEMTLTFPATAPTVATATLTATSFDTAKATATVTSGAAATVYYALYVGSGTPSAPTADVIKAGTADATNWKYTSSNTAGDYSANFTGLSPYKSYTLYATAVVTANATAGPLSAVVSGTDTTFHKVTVKVDDATHGNITAPGGAAAGTVTVGVDHDTTLAITATETSPWLFKAWTISTDGGAVSAATDKSATYTASGTAAEVTLTATYEASYGIIYDVQGGNPAAPTDSTKYPASGTVKTQSYSGTKTGFTFGGWSAKTDGSSPITAGSGTVTIADLAKIQTGIAAGGNYALYAVWTPKTITAAATAMADGTYGTDGYNYAAGKITAKYNDGAAGVPGTVVTQANLSFVQKTATSEEKTLTDLGLALNDKTGAITGRPRQVGTFKFTVTVTDSASGSTDEVQLTLTVGKATPTLKVYYGTTNEKFYVGDALDATKFVSPGATTPSTATAPFWDSSKSAWVENHAVTADTTNGWKFKTETVYKLGDHQSYDVTFTPNATDGALYKSVDGKVSITAIGKTYGITINAGAAIANGIYLDGATKATTFTITSNGNQPSTFTTANYALSGTDAAAFEVSNHVTSLAAGATSSDITVTATTGNRTVGVYVAKLTVTDAHGEKATLDLSYTVTPKEIPGAAITGLVVPVKGGTPVVASALSGSNNTVDANSLTPYGIAISWAPSAATFAAGTVYTATVTLTANANYKFAAESANNYTIAEVVGVTPDITVTTGAGGTVTYTVTFPATAPEMTAVVAKAKDQMSGEITKLTATSNVPVTFYYVVTTSATAPTVAQILAGRDNAGTTATASGSVNSTTVSGNVATWTGTQPISALANGTQYHVYATAQTTTGAASATNLAKTDFTTWYAVTVKIADGQETNGSITAPAVSPVYVAPGENVKLVATENSGFSFKTWAVTAGTGTFGDNGTAIVADAEKGKTSYFWPTANSTVEASYAGEPLLKLTGTERSDRVSESYPADWNIYQDARVTNEGGGALKGKLSITAEKTGVFTIENIKYYDKSNTERTESDKETLPAGGYATFDVILVAGLKASVTPYTDKILVSDGGNAPKAEKSLTINIVDGLAIAPYRHFWDINHHLQTPNKAWAMTITHNGYDAVVSMVRQTGNATLTDPTDYTYSNASPASTLTVNTTYLAGVAGAHTAGEKELFTLTMKNSGSLEQKDDKLEVLYIDTTPRVNGANITADTNTIAIGTTLTATATAMTKNASGQDDKQKTIPTADYATKVTFTWYMVEGNQDGVGNSETNDTVVQAASADATYKIIADGSYYVVVTGVPYNASSAATTGWYTGSATATETGASALTVTYAVDPTAGGSAPTHGATVQLAADGNGHTDMTAVANPGYAFAGWTVATDGGYFSKQGVSTKPASGNTFADAAMRFWANKSTTVTAKFDLLPTLAMTPTVYNVGAEVQNKVQPVLTYAKNNGTFSKVSVKDKDNAVVAIAEADFTLGSGSYGDSTTYTLTTAWLNKLTAAKSPYVITFEDSKGYNTTATLTVENVNKQLPGYTVAEADPSDTAADGAYLVAGNTVKAHPATVPSGVLTGFQYQWYYGATGIAEKDLAKTATKIGTVVTGTATLAITDDIAVAAKGNRLYVMVTGAADYAGDTAMAMSKANVPTPEYVVTANAVASKGTISIDGGATSAASQNKTVQLGSGGEFMAVPANGYKFENWTITSGTGKFGSASGTDTSTDATATFFPTATAVIQANFVAADFTVTAGAAKVLYGNSAFVSNTDVSSASGQTLTYDIATQAELTAASITDQTHVKGALPAWLTYTAASNQFSVGAAVDTNVKSGASDSYTAVDNEVVVYVKMTNNGGTTHYAKYVVNVEPSKLTINGGSFDMAAYKAANSNALPVYGEALLGANAKYFELTSVTNEAATVIESHTTAEAVVTGGAWSADPATFQGGNGVSYTYRYTFNATDADKKWNYTPATQVLSLDSQPANYALQYGDVKTSDSSTTTFAKDATRIDSTPYGTAVEYTVTLKNPGNALTGVTMTQDGNNSTKFTVTNFDGASANMGADATRTFKVSLPATTAPGTYVFKVAAAGSNSTAATYTLTVTVTAATVAGVKVTVPAPVTGEAIKNQPEITISGGKTDFNGTTVTNDAGTTLPDGTKVKVEWMEETTPGSFAPTTDTTFLPNKVYKPVITVKVDGNHKLPADDTTNYDVNGKKDADADAVITVTPPDTAGNNVVLEQTFPKTKVKEIAVTASATYDTDLSDANKPVSANPALYTVNDNTDATTFDNWKWYESDGTTPLKGNKFGRNTTYYVEAKVTVATGVTFADFADLVARGNGTILTHAPLTGAVENVIEITAGQVVTVKFKVTTGGPGGGGGGGGGGETTLKVTYDLSKLGTTKDKTSESVVKGEKPKNVPAVTPKEDYAFAGWAETKDMKDNEKDPILVDPTTVVIEKSKTFYAIYKTTGEHEHYIVGYPDGNFGPADSITRGEVAAIIARSCMEGFEMKKDYGTGGYSDIDGSHWATSAIAFCSNAKIYVGYDDGTFRPDQAITRQEFAQLFARLSGMLSAEGKDVPFTDKGDIANWALDGVYTTVEKEWVVGYEDGTFKPNQDIARAEAVRIVNGYLVRGVNKSGLKMVEKDLKQWPDVPTTHWAYTEILEASNDHTFYFVNGKKPPEGWSKAFIEAPHWNQ